ncbi:MAG: 2OG-Fe(II) oxygenase [Burkholderiales bacterium]
MRAPGDALIDALAAQGYAIAREALPGPVVRGLRERALALDAAGAFVPAGVGRGDARVARTEVRGDRIAWLSDASVDRAEQDVSAWLDALRVRCNRELMLGLEALEAHYAIYPPGARYARHRDRFRDDDARVLSCIVYLNDAWTAGDGGELRLFAGEETVEVLPEGGTLVAFLAADFEHEVLPARRERLALTGWFRRRVLV